MLRLPSQFEPKPSHNGESAAAGGCSTTTCTCCVVSLAAASVLTSIYFFSLVPDAKPEDGSLAFDDRDADGASGPQEAATDAPQVSEGAAPPPEGATEASEGAASALETETDALSALEPAAPEAGVNGPPRSEVSSASASRGLRALFGFFTPLLALVPAGIGLLVDSETVLFIGGPLFLLIWFSAFVKANTSAGRRGGWGFVAGLVALIMLVLAIVVEVNVWWG